LYAHKTFIAAHLLRYTCIQ